MTAGVTVRNNSEALTYDALIDGQVAGSIIYELNGSRVVISHTIVEPEHRDSGVGTELVRTALDDIRAKGMTITNYCGFVSAFIDAHPEYADLIDPVHPGHPRNF